MSTPFLPLDGIGERDLRRVGTKAYRIARLSRAGFPVPPGVVLPADADVPGPEQWAEILRTIARRPGSLFAVRSSAVAEDGDDASFAGVLETRLRVPERDVPEAIVAVRASVGGAPAREYAARIGRTLERLGCAVLIQPMVESEVAGVAFTRDPRLAEPGAVLLESARALPEEIVGGRVQPDLYRFETIGGSFLLMDMTRGEPGRMASLRESEAREIAELARRIETLFECPVDVEWALGGTRTWILQARPITATPAVIHAETAPPPEPEPAPPPVSEPEPEPQPEPEPEPVRAPVEPVTEAHAEVPLRVAPGVEVWARVNYREVLPEVPSMLTRSFLDSVHERAWEPMRPFCRRPHGPSLRWFRGRPYCNLSLLQDAFATLGKDVGVLLQRLGDPGNIPPGLLAAEPAGSLAGAFLRSPRGFLRTARRVLGARRSARRLLKRMERSRGGQGTEPSQAIQPTTEESLRARCEWSLEIFEAAMGIGASLSAGYDSLLSLLGRALPNPVGFVNAVTAGAGSEFAALHPAMLEIARTLYYEPEARERLPGKKPGPGHVLDVLHGTRAGAEIRALLDRFGHRGIGETDVAEPRYAEDPSPLLRLLASIASGEEPTDADSILATQKQREREAWAELHRASSWRSLPARWLARRIRNGLHLREELRDSAARVLAVERRRDLALARAWVQQGILATEQDYFFLRWEEIAGVLHGREAAMDIRERIAARRREADEDRKRRAPNLLIGDGAPPPAPGAAKRGTPLRGLPVSPGRAEGEVAVVRRPEDWKLVRPGQVIVIPVLEPGVTPLLALPAALVVEMGGLLSHGAILARECAIPAVSNLPGVTGWLRAGDRVLVDGWAGTVTLLVRAK